MPSWQQKATGADPIERGSVPPRVVWDPGMHRRLLHGNRESSVTALRGRSQGRNGKTGGHRPARPFAGPQREDRRSSPKMNGTEQSDSPIVPKKLANKAAHAAAEPMEGSGGAERNAK